MGDTFLRSFISIFDFENKTVGLAPHIYSKGTITRVPEPIYIKKTLLFIIIAVSIGLALIVNTCVAYKIIRIKRNKKDTNENATAESLVEDNKN